MMKRIALLFLLLFNGFLAQAQTFKTKFELSGGKETPTYFEGIAYYESLAEQFPEIDIRSFGETDSGYPLHLVIFSYDQNFDFQQAHEAGKAVMMINNAIHPGEPDGVDACMMFLRDYVTDARKKEQLKDVVIAIIPFYNIGGTLNRNSTTRVNQDGPASYGFRGNARNLDLNRDFIKADSKNAKAFAEIYHTVKPDVFIDTHVSNGADYQYAITHLATQHNKLGGFLGKYLLEEMVPRLEKRMKEKDAEIIPFVNVYNSPPDKNGYTQFMDWPRYSTGYTTLFHTIGFMIETHMLKPFDQRVKATYAFLESLTEITVKDKAQIKTMRKRRMERSIVGSTHPLSWKMDKSSYRQLEFKGYEAVNWKSNVTGLKRLYYDRNSPYTKVIPYYNHFSQDNVVKVPKAYVIPKSQSAVIERLKMNNVDMQLIDSDQTAEVEVYTIDKFQTVTSPYEGHYLHYDVEVSAEKEEIVLKKGEYYIVNVEQDASRYIIETLEPQAADSFFNWNFFDAILQQKEHFSPYVFEDLAEELLKADKALKKEFEEKRKKDVEFAENWYAQLDFIYKRSAHHEKAYRRYPIYRLMN
ncbi:MAG: M14 family metallopeptidase [Bacteroidota bacterium]